MPAAADQWGTIRQQERRADSLPSRAPITPGQVGAFKRELVDALDPSLPLPEALALAAGALGYASRVNGLQRYILAVDPEATVALLPPFDAEGRQDKEKLNSYDASLDSVGARLRSEVGVLQKWAQVVREGNDPRQAAMARSDLDKLVVRYLRSVRIGDTAQKAELQRLAESAEYQWKLKTDRAFADAQAQEWHNLDRVRSPGAAAAGGRGGRGAGLGRLPSLRGRLARSGRPGRGAGRPRPGRGGPGLGRELAERRRS